MQIMRIERLKKLYTFLIVMLPVFGIYAIPGINIPVSIGELLIIMLLPFLMVDILFNKRKIVDRNPFWFYLIYAFIATIISSLFFSIIESRYSMSNAVNRMVRDSIYMSMIVIWGSHYFDFEKAVNLIKKVAIILSVFIYIQFILYQFAGFYLSGFIPNVRTTLSGGAVSDEVAVHFLKMAMQDGYIRGYGFMSEPAAAAHFLSIALLLVLFSQKGERMEFKKAIIYSVAMILTFSVNSYVAFGFCWFIWFVAKKKTYKEMIVITVLTLIGCVCIVPCLATDNFISDVLTRLFSVFSGGNTQNSIGVRIFRGPAFYLEMPFVFKVFGSGFGNFDDFKAIFRISTIYEQETEYLSTNSYVAISSGIIGSVLYFLTILKNTMRKKKVTKSLALLLFLYGMSSSLYSSATFVIILSLIFYCPVEEKRDGKNNYLA